MGRKISPQRVLQELAAIAFARVPDYMDSEGNLKKDLKPQQRVNSPRLCGQYKKPPE